MKPIRSILSILLVISAAPSYGQFTPVSDANANSAATQLLTARRNESGASVAQVTVVDPAGFVDGGTIVFPALDGTFIYLVLQSVKTDGQGLFFKAASSDSLVQGFFSLNLGSILNGSISIGGNSTYITVESVDGGNNQHVISKYTRIRPSLTSPTGNGQTDALPPLLKRLSAAQLQKADDRIVRDATDGRSQRLIVNLDQDGILDRQRVRRAVLQTQRGTDSVNEASTLQLQSSIDDDAQREIRDLQDKVIRELSIPSIDVVKRYLGAGALILDVNSLAALAALLSHPQVTGVFLDAKATPTAENSVSKPAT